MHFVSLQVRIVTVEKKSNEVLNRLNKTKQEASPDFRAMREERDRKQRSDEKRKMQKQVILCLLLMGGFRLTHFLSECIFPQQ